MRKFYLVLMALVVLLVLPAAARAQGSKVTINDVNRIAKQLYCPVCPNTPLDVCETQACEDWRELIRQKLEAGESDQEIINYFVAQYGERVLATPRPRGFNLLGYLVPPVLLLAGVAFLALLLRGWIQRPAPAAATGEPAAPVDELPAEYVERLERQLYDYQ